MINKYNRIVGSQEKSARIIKTLLDHVAPDQPGCTPADTQGADRPGANRMGLGPGPRVKKCKAELAFRYTPPRPCTARDLGLMPFQQAPAEVILLEFQISAGFREAIDERLNILPIDPPVAVIVAINRLR